MDAEGKEIYSGRLMQPANHSGNEYISHVPWVLGRKKRKNIVPTFLIRSQDAIKPPEQITSIQTHIYTLIHRNTSNAIRSEKLQMEAQRAVTISQNTDKAIDATCIAC